MFTPSLWALIVGQMLFHFSSLKFWFTYILLTRTVAILRKQSCSHFYEPCLCHIDNWIGSEVPLCSVSNQAYFIPSFNSLVAFNCIWMIFVSEVCDVNPLFDFSFTAQEASQSQLLPCITFIQTFNISIAAFKQLHKKQRCT